MASVKPFDLTRLDRVFEEAHSLEELREKFASGRQLRIKYGVDATAPFLHIGHAVNLWIMRDLQDHGHKVVFLVGDFTTRIGDPTDKDQTRGRVSHEEIAENGRLYVEQVAHILRTDDEVFEVRHNSEWYSRMDPGDFLSLLAMVTHSRLIQRDMFERRISLGREIYMHELTYPVLQGYDSFALESDLTIVGTDQLFNELMGRFFQQRLGQDPQVVLTTRITPGIDGREKQSKSLGNYIALSDSAREKFGKSMRIKDELVREFAEVYTTIPLNELDHLDRQLEDGQINPMNVKRVFARALVERYHGHEVAREEDAWFRRVFSEQETPDNIPEVVVEPGMTLLEVLEKCLPDESRSELRRLARAGAVRLEGAKIADADTALMAPLDEHGAVLRVGRRRWFRLLPSRSPISARQV